MVKDPLGFFFLRTNIFLKINIPIGTQNSGYNPSKTLVLLRLYFLINKVRKTGKIIEYGRYNTKNSSQMVEERIKKMEVWGKYY